jgi:hypothetical protein
LADDEKEASRVENAEESYEGNSRRSDSILRTFSIRQTASLFCLRPQVRHRFRSLWSRSDDLRGGKDFGTWGAPSMMALEGGSAGLQLGGNLQTSFFSS